MMADKEQEPVKALAFDDAKARRNLHASLRHEAYPDGRSGPWLRKPHAVSSNIIGAIIFDARCAKCRSEGSDCLCKFWRSRRTPEVTPAACPRHGVLGHDRP